MPRKVKQTCSNCRYSIPRIDDKTMCECRRRAPAPANSFIFYLAELFRDIAWSQHYISNSETPSECDDLNKEATEASSYAIWPYVQRDDWCGEWERGR